MKRIKHGSILVTLACIFMIAGRGFLVVDEEPKKADVIIVLSGDTGRLERAAALYKEGYSDYVMLSIASEEGLRAQQATELGVANAALLLEKKATSTYTNAVYTKELMATHSLRSAIVVSSDYHMRRVKLIFDRVYKDSGIELTYVASQRNDQMWYKDRANVWHTFTEFVKIPAYALRLYKFVDIE
ncbi:YdcF family protein [Bacillus sp. 37MA]|uniref:YdcF family protein n=1 Tax=Bacillus sp. 37MA TaxID=1132442 RepID=UPI00037482A0|nr:YdcF family protein [Bacillus sp. 37MA]